MINQNAFEQSLSRDELIALKNKRMGLAIFQVSWILVFVCLILVNMSLRGQSESWPPPGVEKVGALLPTVMTAALIASSIFAHQGLKAVRQDNIPLLIARIRFTLGLGVLFLGVMGIEWITIPISGQYSDVFRMMTGFHGVHAVVIGLYLFTVFRQAHAGFFTARNYWPIEAAVGLWDFVTVAWILFYIVIYWV